MSVENDLYANEIDEHEATVTATRSVLREPFAVLVSVCIECLRGGGKIFFFGNGGSAADAQHLATELVVRYRRNRPSLAAVALTTDTSALTAIGNDFGFEDLFSRQIEGVGRKGDVAIGISTSGNSPNVLKALQQAKSAGLTTIGFGGGTGGKMVQLCDIALIVPSKTTARIQECHILYGHMLCEAIEVAFASGGD